MAKVKNQKKNTAEAAAGKRKRDNKKTLNPFEVHINKDKQNVLGRKSKADHGLPGVARAKALSKRKNTLLQEYKHKDKDNVFVDRRIGEKNNSMSQEEKSMARFAAERVKSQKKKQMFSLHEDEVLTHRGQTLEEIEKFEDPKSDDEWSDEENRDGRLDKKFVSEAHFGGGILSKSDGDKLSRKDLIQQLIIESKKRKAEKQKVREETIDLTAKLDTEWKDLLPLMASTSQKNKSDELLPICKADDYDISVRQLKFESRGTPSDKLKSEEDLVREEKEALEALERDRLARMKGLSEESQGKNAKHKSADDLDDDFQFEPIDREPLAYDDQGRVKGLETDPDDCDNQSSVDDKRDYDDDDETGDDSEADEDQADSEKKFPGDREENDESEKNTSQETENQSDSEEDDEDLDDEEDYFSDLKFSEGSSEDENTIEDTNSCKQFSDVQSKDVKSIETQAETTVNGTSETSMDERRVKEIRDDLQRRKEIMEKARQQLPYTYKAPESYEEMLALVRDHSPDYQSIIFERIIKCNHWTLGQGNKEKLCNVFEYLLKYIVESATVIVNKNNGRQAERVFEYFQLFDRLCPHLYDLAQVNAHHTATCVQNLLRSHHEEFELRKHKYPGLETLTLFKIVSLLFPTSDFRHPVVTPSIVFMSQILLRCRVKTRRDIAMGLFVCTLLLEYTLMSKRFAPSAINFLRGVIHLATPKAEPALPKIIPPFKCNGAAESLLVLDEDRKSLAIDVEAPCMRASDLCQTEFDDEFKIRAFVTAVNMAAEFKEQLEELEAAYVIFEPIVKLLKINSYNNYPKNIKKHAKAVRKNLQTLADKTLEYIVREKKKPKALRLYEPRIETVYDGKKHRPMSREKAGREKLLHKIKKETKSAMREVRRDRAFLAKVQIKQQIKSDTERKRKVKEIYGEASVQQGELNEIKRKK